MLVSFITKISFIGLALGKEKRSPKTRYEINLRKKLNMKSKREETEL